jgi:hypothetical protein
MKSALLERGASPLPFTLHLLRKSETERSHLRTVTALDITTYFRAREVRRVRIGIEKMSAVILFGEELLHHIVHS